MIVVSRIKKIPAPLALLLAIAGLVGGIFAIKSGQAFLLRASEETAPHNLKISNITDSSFAVSWTTEKKTTGQVIFGRTSSLEKAKDDLRDEKKSQPGQYFTHFVTVDSLNPSTKYFFKIVSGQSRFGQSGKPYETTTAPQKTPPDSDIAQGKILNPDGSPANGALVYLSLPNTLVQAAITDNSGHWMIPLSLARTPDLQNFSLYDRNAQTEEISVFGETKTASAVLTTANDNPVPDITLDREHDFQTPLPVPTTPTTSVGNSSGFPSGGSSQFSQLDQELTISSPEEREQINTQRPEFFGSGPSNKELSITIESEEKISAEITVDKNGKWNWSPTQKLSPGEHKITVSCADENGFLKTVSRNFIVLAAGESSLPSFTATPSGETTTPTVTPRPVAISPTPRITATVAPTATINPTSSPTNMLQEPTATPYDGRTAIPSGQPLDSGNKIPTWIFFGGGIITIMAGVLLLL